MNPCCDLMDLQYTGKTYVTDKYFAKNVKCVNCKRTGTDFFDVDKGTKSRRLFTEMDND